MTTNVQTATCALLEALFTELKFFAYLIDQSKNHFIVTIIQRFRYY